METDEGRAAEEGGGGGRSRAFKVLAWAGFALVFVSHLLRGRWLTAAFFVAVGILFLKGKEIDRLPKPVRVILSIVYAALAVGMFFQLIADFKAMR